MDSKVWYLGGHAIKALCSRIALSLILKILNSDLFLKIFN